MVKVLTDYRRIIDEDIAAYCKYLRTSSQAQFGSVSKPTVQAFVDILNGGGKRLRGSLTMIGYEMCGGTNTAMIIQAARAMEMIHASLLLIDDVQDRSERRHGKPAAQVKLTKQLQDEHLADSLAVNAGLLGGYAAQMILSNLDAPAELRTNVLSITNRTLTMTVQGQSADMLGSVESEKVALWKTAQYSVLNPLHVGMVLAGAGCEATDAITPFALEIGIAYQIKNDIEGVFVDDGQKDPGEDLREGKRTVLTEYAQKHAKGADKHFLQQALGNPKLSKADIVRCLQIFEKSGAQAFAQHRLKTHQDNALKALKNCGYKWPGTGEELLAGLAS